MATQIKFKRGTTLNSDYTIGTFSAAAEPWFISGTGLNQLYVDGIPINKHLKAGGGLSITETLGIMGELESYDTVALDLSTYSSTTLGNALELITTGTAGEIGLFVGYNLFVGDSGATTSTTSVADDEVYIHMRSKNGNNHDKIKIVSGTGATVTAANDVITISATGVGVTLYDLIWQNYGSGTSVLYDAETTGHVLNATGGLKFTQAGTVTSLTDTRRFIVGNADTDVDNEVFSGRAYLNMIGAGDAVDVQRVYGSVAFEPGLGMFLSSENGVITISSLVEDTHYTSQNIVAETKTATTEATVATNGVYLNHLEQTTLTSSTYIIGSNGIKVFSDVAGKINIRGTRIVVSNSATGITDATSFAGPVYINLVGDNDGDETLEVLDSVKLVGSGTASLAVGSTAKEITINSTDNDTIASLEMSIDGTPESSGYYAQTTWTVDAGTNSVGLKTHDSTIGFSETGTPGLIYIDVILVDGGTF